MRGWHFTMNLLCNRWGEPTANGSTYVHRIGSGLGCAANAPGWVNSCIPLKPCPSKAFPYFMWLFLVMLLANSRIEQKSIAGAAHQPLTCCPCQQPHIHKHQMSERMGNRCTMWWTAVINAALKGDIDHVYSIVT